MDKYAVEMTLANWIIVFICIAIALVLYALFYSTPLEQGEEDYLAGMSKADCPYNRGSWQYECWHEGYDLQCRMSKLAEMVKESKK